jgi:hypothetical protein
MGRVGVRGEEEAYGERRSKGRGEGVSRGVTLDQAHAELEWHSPTGVSHFFLYLF